MRVAITGASGRVGRFVTREFAEAGHSVVGVDLLEPEEIHAGLEYRRADIAQPDELRAAFEGCEAIVHLAAIPEAGLASWGVTFAVNALGTVNCLEAATAVGSQRFVFASSEAVLGYAYREIDFAPETFPLDERSPLIPQDSYGASKIAAEEACRAFTRSGALSTVCVRPCYCWGVELGAEATQSLEHPEDHWRSLWVYIHLRDIARVYRLACEHPTLEHETFYAVADDIRSNVPTRELVERFYPGTAVSDDLGEYGSLISNKRMRRVLDFAPSIRWRDELEAADFPSSLGGAAGEGPR